MSGEVGVNGEVGMSDEARDSMQSGWCSSSDYNGVITWSLVRCACVSGETQLMMHA